MKRPRGSLLVLSFVVLALLLHGPLVRRWRAGQLLLALSTSDARAASAPALIETDVMVPGRKGPIRARLYRLPGGRKPGLVIAHGVHWRGIDEGRLVPFARELARAGRVVLTPELSELADYRITRQGVDVISDAAHWLSAREEIVSESRVGLLGFSFAGGLALVAASQPELAERVAYVTSVGGHHHLGRVLGFLLNDEISAPNRIVRETAHEYGLVVLVYGNLERFADEADLETMRKAFRAWLEEDRRTAVAIASGRQTASGELLFRLLESGRLKELRPQLEALLRERTAELEALSPHGRLRGIAAPVYLLHGAGDTVIPASETEWADLELAGAPHRTLVSPLIDHVEVGKSAALGDELALVEFMARLL